MACRRKDSLAPMRNQIHHSISEKLDGGNVIENPYLRSIVRFFIHEPIETGDTPSIYSLEVNRDDVILVRTFWNEGEIHISKRDQLNFSLILLSEDHGLTPRERAYLLAKVPAKGSRKKESPGIREPGYWLGDKEPSYQGPKRKPKPPKLKLPGLRITYKDGKTSYHPESELNDVIPSCRKNGWKLHQNVKGEWREIV